MSKNDVTCLCTQIGRRSGSERRETFEKVKVKLELVEAITERRGGFGSRPPPCFSGGDGMPFAGGSTSLAARTSAPSLALPRGRASRPAARVDVCRRTFFDVRRAADFERWRISRRRSANGARRRCANGAWRRCANGARRRCANGARRRCANGARQSEMGQGH